MSPALADVLRRHRALVCVGTGGVGKTTVAAALGLAAARRGLRTMVLTIDPARQLARSLGLQTLGLQGEAVDTAGYTKPGLLFAGMLDLKGAWDAFIARHAPSAVVRDALYANPFYQRLSTSFAGSTEYMAIEELCRLDESHEWDLIIIDTPPSAHAIDFIRAPERLERLLAPEVSRWLLGRERGGALQVLTSAVHFAVRRLENAFGTRTMAEISAFFGALDALFGDLSSRAERARALLYGEDTAFVMVVAPTAREMTGAVELSGALRGLGAPLKAAIANRVHPLAGANVEPALIEQAVEATAAEPVVREWLRETWATAKALDQAERTRLDGFLRALPSDTTWVEVPELDHDAHALADLMTLASTLCPDEPVAEAAGPPTS